MKTFLFVLALTLASSARAQQVVSNWQRLDGQHSGVKEPMAVAVQDDQQWQQLWRRHDASAPAPKVDFTHEAVIVVFAGERQSAGVTVQIVVQKDPIDSNRLNVFYSEVVTKKVFSAQVQCQPYAFVKVPKVATIDLEPNGRMSIPDLAPADAPKLDERKMRALTDGIKDPSFDGN
jgi:hypothetical protein